MSGNHRGPMPLVGGQAVSFIPRDRLNRPLKRGMIVSFHQGLDLIAKIVDINPVMHPGAQPGLVSITLAVDQFQTAGRGGVPMQQFIIIGEPEMADRMVEATDELPSDASH